MRLIPGWLAPLTALLLLTSPVTRSEQHTSHTEIHVAGDPWPPWIIGEEGELASGGIFVEICHRLLSHLLMPHHIRIYPFPRVMDKIKRGEADIALMVSPTKEREEIALFTLPLVSSPYYFYSLRPFELSHWDSYSQLGQYKVGATRFFNYGEAFARAHTSAQFTPHWSINEQASLTQLLNSRLEIVVLNQASADWLSHQHKNTIKPITPAIYTPDFGLMLSRKSPLSQKQQEINNGILLMKKSGEIDRIVKQWFKSRP